MNMQPNKSFAQKKSSTQKGFVKTIIIIVVALIILGYFGFNLREIISRPVVHDNLVYFKEIVIDVWTLYLRAPVMFLWNEVFVKLIWEPFVKSRMNS